MMELLFKAKSQCLEPLGGDWTDFGCCVATRSGCGNFIADLDRVSIPAYARTIKWGMHTSPALDVPFEVPCQGVPRGCMAMMKV